MTTVDALCVNANQGVVNQTSYGEGQMQVTASKTPGKGTVTLSEIARSMKIDPKTARRKARAAMKKPKAGWVFSSAMKGKIVKILKGEE